jgi:hypothetical protein
MGNENGTDGDRRQEPTTGNGVVGVGQADGDRSARAVGASGSGRARPGLASLAAVAAGAAAVGALAVGALAIGRLRIGDAAVRRLRIGQLEVDELRVRRLHVLGPE